jgi:hypothetical protein
MSVEGAYSKVADAQLDALENGPDVALYNSILDTIEFIFRLSGRARALSTAITTPEGIRMRLPVIGHPPYKVFWSTDGPRIEAIFPHP